MAISKDEQPDTNLRTFNAAKLFAEGILFPLMSSYQKLKRQSDFGSESLGDARMLDGEIKDIERYNGLKGMNDTVASLLSAITSTVRLKGNKQENAKLDEITETVVKLTNLFYDSKENFFLAIYRDREAVQILNREYFNRIKKIVDACYINTEILMTRNKLLFSDASDEFLTDEEIKEQIKQDYIEG